MIFSKVRTYINQSVLAVDPTFKEWDDAFNFENIPSSRFQNAFYLSYSVPSIDTNDSVRSHSVSADLKLFVKGFKKPQEALDNAMDTANLMANTICSITNVEAFRTTDNFPIQAVTVNSIEPTPLDSNDNNMEININFTLLILEGIC